jgi:membrane protease YdiL (CAAX protease family)
LALYFLEETLTFAHTKNSKIVASLLFIFYLVVIYGFIKQLDSYGPYASYIFEALFIFFVCCLYRRDLKVKFRLTVTYILQVGFSLILGFCIFKFAHVLGISIPFDLKDPETRTFLVVLGPILEEFLFRQALWSCAARILNSPGSTVILTSLLFSFAHFFSYFFVPSSIRPFIIYQTIYVLFLGLRWGVTKKRTGSITATIFLHIAFNSGFLLGSFFLI